MSLELDAIRTAYETLHLTPELIAEARGMDVLSVQTALAACSPLYRRVNKLNGNTPLEGAEGEDLDFTNEDLREANAIILTTAKEAEHPDGTPDYRTRFAAAVYIRDDKKGRKLPPKQVTGGNTFNIFEFNAALKEAREAKQRTIPV